MHIVVGLIVAFVIVALVARSRKTTRHCRWRADRSGDKGNLRKYICSACGAEAFTASSGPPETCKAKTKPPSL